MFLFTIVSGHATSNRYVWKDHSWGTLHCRSADSSIALGWKSLHQHSRELIPAGGLWCWESCAGKQVKDFVSRDKVERGSVPRKMSFMSTILLVHTRHYISGEKFIAITFLFPFLPSFWWHNSVKRKGHTLMPRWFITLIPAGTIDPNNLWLKCISSSAFSLGLKLNK